jgi:hypothetical protein
MADDCDSAIIFWDGKSKGSQFNMDYMEKIGKYCLVWEPGCLSCINLEKINNMVIL